MELSKKKVISSLFWKLLERCGVSVSQLVIQIILARILLPEQFGALAIILVFVNIGNVIVQSGLNTALVQCSDIGENDGSVVFWISFVIAVILSALIWFFAPDIASFYEMPDIVWPTRILSFLFLINAYNSVQVAISAREFEFKKIFKASVVSVLSSGALGLLLAVWGAGLWALVIQQLANQLIYCITLGCLVTWKPRLVFNFQRAKQLISFGWKILVSGLIDAGYKNLLDLMVGKIYGDYQLGLLSQGRKYPQTLGTVLDGSIQSVMLSAVSRVQDDVLAAKRLVRRALKTSAFLIVPTMFCLALVAEPLILLMLGEKWIDSVPFLQLYCLNYALIPLQTTNLQAINGMGRSDIFLKLELVKKPYGITILFFAAFVLQDIYAIVGGFVIASALDTFVNAFPNKKILGYAFREQIEDIFPSFAISGIACVVAWPVAFLDIPTALLLLLQVIVVFLVYFGLSRLLKVESMQYVRDVMRNFL